MNTIKNLTKKNSGFSVREHDGGYWVQKLEESFKEYFKVKHAVAMNSATACLHSACVACGKGEFIVSPFTFSASVSCVIHANSQPVFADIEDTTYTISPDKILENINSDTRAIIPVHLHGHPALMDSIMALAKKFSLRVIEDATQAIGAEYHGKKVGTIGDCGVFSFNRHKHINTGEGGILITNDDYIARVARAMRNHGELSDPSLGIVGYNFRLCEIEAYLAHKQFQKLDWNLRLRNELTARLTEGIKDLPLIETPVIRPNCYHAFYTYPIKYFGDREKFQKKMLDDGIYFGNKYLTPLNLNRIFKWFVHCPVAEKVSKEIVVTDIFKPPMRLKEVDRIIERVRANHG